VIALRSISRPRLVALLAAVLIAAVPVVAPGDPQAASPPDPPAGLTAFSLQKKVVLAWQASPGSAGYDVYRGTSVTSITTKIASGLTVTKYTDTSVVNAITYYYVVRASASGLQSGNSQIAQATPRARTCSSGNAVALENCTPGTTAWKPVNPLRAYAHGIDGYGSASSVNAGQSIDLRVAADWDAPYRIEIYRTGYYGGSQARLVSVIPALKGKYPPNCYAEPSTTGVADCSSWPVTTTITTTTDWPSGVYVLKLVREDNATDGQILLIVRADGSTSELLYHVPTSTYQAYNRSEGKALYDGLSGPPITVAGTNRAVMASFDRPYSQVSGGPDAHDWYMRTDMPTVSWLEQQGYNITYLASEDFHTSGAQLKQHKVFISGGHDEYWSKEMYDAAVAARDAGTSLVFMGANDAYWKVRFEPSPVSGRANRVMVTYKTIQSGPADPSGIPTTTWRDPSGPNRPENALIGQMYVGENIGKNFPLVVSADQGRHRSWRYTTVAGLAAGTSASIGTALVGWEWDARVSNGQEPAGVTTLAASPVNGDLIQNNGASQALGSTTQHTTLYRAGSGALVFATGTMNLWRGLALNVDGAGEPDVRVRQALMNVLADMDVRPTKPASGLTVDPLGRPAVVSTSPINGAGLVATNARLTVTFDRQLDPSTVDNADFALKSFSGASIPLQAALDNATKTVTLLPASALEPYTLYTATMGTDIKSWHGDSPQAYSWSFSTGQGSPPVVQSRTPSAGATGTPTDGAVTAQFDRRLDPATVNSSTFKLKATATGVSVAGTVSYDSATRTARLVPSQWLTESTGYTATLSTGIKATDGRAMAAADTWSFTTGTNLTVTSRTPDPLASGLSPSVAPRAVFSRAADPASMTMTTFRLTDPSGSVVPAAISYDGASRTATLTPSAPLTLLTTYTVTLTGGVHAADGGPLNPTSWTFTTASTPPPAPVVTSSAPVAGATGTSINARVLATFDLQLDPATVTNQSFTLKPDGGVPVPATVTYDAAAARATLTPSAALATGTRYTATLTTALRTPVGARLATDVTWAFTTGTCPCSLMTRLTPSDTGIPVQDGRAGAGPFSYELGTKITVTEGSRLIALRFHKDPGETGTHIGHVWNTFGAELATVTFGDETASGWQQQSVDPPLDLQAGATYVISVGLNSRYVKTPGGLAAQLTSGPLRSVADGSNGVYADAAGQFPAKTYMSSNYFVDAVVSLPATGARTPQVTTVSPADGATGVSRTTSVKATFNLALNPKTVKSSTFTLTDASGIGVPAAVSYDDDTLTTTLTPSAALDTATTYTARLSTDIRSDDDTALATAKSWTFITVPPGPPVVTQTSPAAGATDISPLTAVTATFSQAMDPATINDTTMTLQAGTGSPVATSVAYDGPTRTATLQPSAPLSESTVYTARIGTGARSVHGVAMDEPASWTFTTSACPCSLFGSGPASVGDSGLSTSNGRPAPGPWSLELGVKLTVTQPAQLEAVRFWKDAGETGKHTGRVWSSDGALLGSVTFAVEAPGAGWQEQALVTPISLVPGQTYVVSVGMNASFGSTAGGLAAPVVSGPLRSVADGKNGVYGDADGVFPTQYYASSNYWIDALVR